MIIKNHLTEEHRRRAEGVQPAPTMMAKSYYSGIEAAELFAKKYLNPVFAGQLKLTDRETAIFGLYYRTIAFCRSLLVLNNAIHFQSLTSATRSILDLYLDIEIQHRDCFADGVERFNAFTDAQRLSAARKTVRFFTDNSQFDPSPSPIDAQRELIAKNEAGIDAQTERLWGLDRNGKPRMPQH